MPFKDVELPQTLIVGGYDAQRREFPYQISLQVNFRHVCGGSILNEMWILTAGHCITASPNSMRVVAGMLHQGENHPDLQISGVVRTIVHPYFAGDVAPNDIALVQLGPKLKWTAAVKPIRLPSPNEESSGLTWVSGWGYLSSANPVVASTLQKVQLQIITFNQCANNLISLIGDYRPLDNTMICVAGANTGAETICQGDSGGPLMQNGKLLGVTSWTIVPCGQYGAPSVYTKVSKFIPFIKQYVPGV